MFNVHAGLFSSTMRDQSNITHDGSKWIVLDGDIDPMWIESLNTVMDDNKVFSLDRPARVVNNDFSETREVICKADSAIFMNCIYTTAPYGHIISFYIFSIYL